VLTDPVPEPFSLALPGSVLAGPGVVCLPPPRGPIGKQGQGSALDRGTSKERAAIHAKRPHD
jgi:hypothetical protein